MRSTVDAAAIIVLQVLASVPSPRLCLPLCLYHCRCESFRWWIPSLQVVRAHSPLLPRKSVPIWPANQRKLATASGVRITSPAVPVDHANASLVHQPSTLVITLIRCALVLIGAHPSALRRPLSALSDCVHQCAAASPKPNTPPGSTFPS